MPSNFQKTNLLKSIDIVQFATTDIEKLTQSMLQCGRRGTIFFCSTNLDFLRRASIRKDCEYLKYKIN